MTDVAPSPDNFDLSVPVIIVGAGAAGLVAALAAHEAGHQVLVLEREAHPSGSTALSAGLIPAAGTRLQRAAGIDDTAERFATDIQAKAGHRNDASLVRLMTSEAAGVIDWLEAAHDLPFSLVDDFDYPGHSRRRMHGLPSRSGRELIDALRSRCESVGIDIVCRAKVDTLYRDEEQIVGVGVARSDGRTERIRAGSVVLACNGYGGNRDLVRRYMPDIQDAVWFGHDGNKGDALIWGEALNAKKQHLGAYQGHGNVAHPHGILITWAVITEGGFQVNNAGKRFWDESRGYSEAARVVLAQPDGIAFTIFDARIAETARQFADFRDAEAQGAILTGKTLVDLEAQIGLPTGALNTICAEISTGVDDVFGRRFSGYELQPPFHAVRVTGALFHTQGGLVIDQSSRVVNSDGVPFDNLFAVGGAACGVSGVSDDGYLSGNGLLSAVTLGRIAGRHVAN